MKNSFRGPEWGDIKAQEGARTEAKGENCLRVLNQQKFRDLRGAETCQNRSKPARNSPKNLENPLKYRETNYPSEVSHHCFGFQD